MMFGGMGWGAGGFLGPLLTVLFWVLVIAGAVWLVLAVSGRAGQRLATPSSSGRAIAGTIAAVSAVGLFVLAVVATSLGPNSAMAAMGSRMVAGSGGHGMMAAGTDNGRMADGLGMMGGHGMGGAMGASGHMGSMAMAEVESEFDYLANMIPHHEEAIVAARALLQGTERPELKAFAQSIIDVQSAELAQMRSWLATWYPGKDATVAYEPMMRDLARLSGDELDRAFLEDMIPHHMAAVMMSQQLLSQDLAEHDAVVPFAEGIRDAQHAEILQMATWLRDRFGVSPMGAGMMRR